MSKILVFPCFVAGAPVNLLSSDFLFLKRSLSFSASVFCLFYPAGVRTSPNIFTVFCKHTNRRDPKLKQFSL